MLVCTERNHCPQDKSICCAECDDVDCPYHCEEANETNCVLQQYEVEDDMRRPVNEMDEYRMQEGKGEL